MSGRSTDEIARTALTHGVLITELTPVHASLQDAYLNLTRDQVEYQPTIPDTTATWRAAA